MGLQEAYTRDESSRSEKPSIGDLQLPPIRLRYPSRPPRKPDDEVKRVLIDASMFFTHGSRTQLLGLLHKLARQESRLKLYFSTTAFKFFRAQNFVTLLKFYGYKDLEEAEFVEIVSLFADYEPLLTPFGAMDGADTLLSRNFDIGSEIDDVRMEYRADSCEVMAMDIWVFLQVHSDVAWTTRAKTRIVKFWTEKKKRVLEVSKETITRVKLFLNNIPEKYREFKDKLEEGLRHLKKIVRENRKLLFGVCWAIGIDIVFGTFGVASLLAVIGSIVSEKMDRGQKRKEQEENRADLEKEFDEKFQAIEQELENVKRERYIIVSVKRHVFLKDFEPS